VRVAVLGASGFIGRALVPVLARRHEVVAVSRSGRADERPGVTSVAADVTETGALRRALESADVVYYLVHSLGSPDFAELDRRAAGNAAAEATRAGVAQIVYLGGLGDNRPDLSPHLRSRFETAAALASGGVPVTTLRAAVVIGRGTAGFETIVALVDRLPVMVAPRWISTPTQPIALADIIRYLAGVAGHPEAIGESFDAGGPEALTYRQMIERVARIRGRRPLIVELPVLSPRLLLAAPRHSGPGSGGPPAHRRPAQPDDRARGSNPPAAPARAHAVRRGGPPGAGWLTGARLGARRRYRPPSAGATASGHPSNVALDASPSSRSGLARERERGRLLSILGRHCPYGNSRGVTRSRAVRAGRAPAAGRPLRDDGRFGEVLPLQVPLGR
jgi:uncharacterized protein YbjT (DUF2867 family)